MINELFDDTSSSQTTNNSNYYNNKEDMLAFIEIGKYLQVSFSSILYSLLLYFLIVLKIGFKR